MKRKPDRIDRAAAKIANRTEVLDDQRASIVDYDEQRILTARRIAALVRRELKRERKAMREAIETARGSGSYYMTVQLKNWLNAREAGR